MKTPFLTVIIPTLNEENYLPRLLSSLVKQTYSHYEVIVVDGQSTDETVSKAKEFIDKLPLQILVSKQKNVSLQRNLGAKAARGVYLVFLDADVELPKAFLKILEEDLRKKQPDFATTRLKADSKDVTDVAMVRLGNLAAQLAAFIDKPFVGGYNFIVKRDIFLTEGGFRADNWHGEDYELSIRLHKAGYTLAILKRPAIIYSLRRFRREGKLTVLSKNTQAALHLFTKGPITKEIFDYPMGGEWYKLKKKEQIKPDVRRQLEARIKTFLKLFLEK